MFPIQIGGLLVANFEGRLNNNIEILIDRVQYIKNVLSYYIESQGKIVRNRLFNYSFLKARFEALGFDINKFIELLTSSGFQVLESGTYFIKPFSHKQMSELIESKIIDVKVLDGLYKMTGYMPDLGSEIYAEFKIHD